MDVVWIVGGVGVVGYVVGAAMGYAVGRKDGAASARTAALAWEVTNSPLWRRSDVPAAEEPKAKGKRGDNLATAREKWVRSRRKVADKCVRLYRAGMPVRAIAGMVGCTPQTVRNHLKAAGVYPRKGGN